MTGIRTSISTTSGRRAHEVQLTGSRDGVVAALANLPSLLTSVLLARGVLASRR